MLTGITKRLTYANAVSTLCLFILLGGTAWAVATNSVGTKQLKDGAVTTPKLKNGAVTAAKLSALGPPTLVKPGANGNCNLASRRAAQFCNGGVGTWSDFGQGYAPARFYKDRSGLVHLEGSVKSAAPPVSITIFFLPAGYRPNNGARNFVVESDDQSPNPTRRFDNVTIRSDGEVRSNNPAVYLSFDGISFRP